MRAGLYPDWNTSAGSQFHLLTPFGEHHELSLPTLLGQLDCLSSSQLDPGSVLIVVDTWGVNQSGVALCLPHTRKKGAFFLFFFRNLFIRLKGREIEISHTLIYSPMVVSAKIGSCWSWEAGSLPRYLTCGWAFTAFLGTATGSWIRSGGGGTQTGAQF